VSIPGISSGNDLLGRSSVNHQSMSGGSSIDRRVSTHAVSSAVSEREPHIRRTSMSHSRSVFNGLDGGLAISSSAGLMEKSDSQTTVLTPEDVNRISLGLPTTDEYHYGDVGADLPSSVYMTFDGDELYNDWDPQWIDQD
jgi:hypothetical protein